MTTCATRPTTTGLPTAGVFICGCGFFLLPAQPACPPTGILPSSATYPSRCLLQHALAFAFRSRVTAVHGVVASSTHDAPLPLRGMVLPCAVCRAPPHCLDPLARRRAGCAPDCRCHSRVILCLYSAPVPRRTRCGACAAGTTAFYYTTTDAGCTTRGYTTSAPTSFVPQRLLLPPRTHNHSAQRTT